MNKSIIASLIKTGVCFSMSGTVDALILDIGGGTTQLTIGDWQSYDIQQQIWLDHLISTDLGPSTPVIFSLIPRPSADCPQIEIQPIGPPPQAYYINYSIALLPAYIANDPKCHIVSVGFNFITGIPPTGNVVKIVDDGSTPITIKDPGNNTSPPLISDLLLTVEDEINWTGGGPVSVANTFSTAVDEPASLFSFCIGLAAMGWNCRYSNKNKGL